jgi:hypothetical protein
MPNTPLKTCQIEPFTAHVTPQFDDPSSVELFIQQIELYLRRLREAMCDDLESIVVDCCPIPGVSP